MQALRKAGIITDTVSPPRGWQVISRKLTIEGTVNENINMYFPKTRVILDNYVGKCVQMFISFNF